MCDGQCFSGLCCQTAVKTDVKPLRSKSRNSIKLRLLRIIFLNSFHVFENLVLRDLIAYADAHGAKILHYANSAGLEADAVYQAADGKYGLIEIKLGVQRIPEAEESLLRFKKAIAYHNENALTNSDHPKPIYREPSALIVICGNAPMAYTTENGVHVIPIGCLRD